MNDKHDPSREEDRGLTAQPKQGATLDADAAELEPGDNIEEQSDVLAGPVDTGFEAEMEARAALARKVALRVAEVGLDKRALNIEIIDVKGKVDYADYLVLMSGRSDRQVQAISRGIEEVLKERDNVRCLATEGLPIANWVLMDFGDVVVHIFHEEARGFYDLESLWLDAARVPVDATMAS